MSDPGTTSPSSCTSIDRDAIVGALLARYPDRSRDRVAAAVDRAAHQLADARVDHYLAILVERVARRELHEGLG